MVKKLVAALLAGSMVLSSSAVVMAGESVAESAAESVAESAAASAAESAEGEVQDADSIDFRGLVETILTEVEKAATEVNLEEKIATLGEKFSEDGTVFAVLADILSDVMDKQNASEAEVDESLEQALEALTSSSDEATDDSSLDKLLNAAVLGIIASEVDEELDEGQKPEDVEIANLVADFVFENVKENEQIAEAVTATGSVLFDMLDNSSEELRAYVAEDDAIEVPEWPFELFEEELAKVTEYINAEEGPKQAALDLLDLVHKVVDEIHYCVHGHTSEDAEGRLALALATE